MLQNVILIKSATLCDFFLFFFFFFFKQLKWIFPHEQVPTVKARTHRDEYRHALFASVFNAFFVFTPKRFSLTMSRVNMQIHSLTLDGA